ncbi:MULTISPECIES: phage GP46 family protein [Aeromonas]|uniref:Phage gp46-like protein n=1 Tax=Aeromonas salmonicida TaxID=645 RepID=A0AAX1PKC1_AERSA|nr:MULTISPECIES: phage GP46 family protein [Aeromonas]RAJ06412.1 phage gp46-like protein [Aeromonas salmonicida]
MTTAITWNNETGRGDIEITSAGLRQDDGLATLVLQILFTDARADPSDVLPDGTNDRRGWIGDTFADEPWGSKLWLLDRSKLTTDVRNKAVTYAQTALERHLKPDYAKQVVVTGAIPQLQMLQLDIAITRPDGSAMTLSIKQRWEAQANAL